jgi:signal recognition particle subunit SRP54
MFNSLSERLTQTLKQITGQAKLTEDNIKSSLREVRMALLEADVALPVVKAFIDAVRERAVGQEVSQALNPGQQFLKIVQSELVHVMGEQNEALDLKAQPPAIVLMAGLQGAGKTTTTAKLARFLKEREKKKVMVVSADVYRPAAIKQLETLADEVEALFHPSDVDQKPEKIVKGALDAARKQAVDVLLVDTAGRLAVDEEMMAEIKAFIKQSIRSKRCLWSTL